MLKMLALGICHVWADAIDRRVRSGMVITSEEERINQIINDLVDMVTADNV